jgi:hypothetical protein
VLDTRSGDWLTVDPHAQAGDVYDEVVAGGPNQSIAVFGGQTWSSGDGELINDLWLWTPPDASGAQP